MTRDNEHLDWPFFESRHRTLSEELAAWAASQRIPELSVPAPDRSTTDEACRKLVRALGASGFLRLCVDMGEHGVGQLDCRSICVARETLASHHALMDFAFAMQGLGSGPISLAGSPEQKRRYLPDVMSGKKIAAFALSEPLAGSDVGGMSCVAEPCADSYILNGEKTWISNGGIADFYVVFARLPGSSRSNGVCAFIVDADSAGFEIAERLDVASPHPLARIRMVDCRVPKSQMLGDAGTGFKLAMQTLDIFRTSVAAAALGFARAAYEAAIDRANGREMFGTTLGSMQITQAKIADMVCAIDSSSLLIYRAAWKKDLGHKVTREAAVAKLVATESAQKVIDSAVQIHGGEGVHVGSKVEHLYRDIRALRIYEGASEVQQLIIGNDVLKTAAKQQGSKP